MITTTPTYNGRLGNQIIRNLAISFIAEKHNLRVSYSSKEKIDQLGIKLFSGELIHDNKIIVNDNNYFEILNSSDLLSNLDSTWSFFQTQDIIHKIYNYLREEPQKNTIIKANPFKDNYNNNNDAVVHIRLTDVEQFNPGVEYYLNAISNIKYNKLYVITDDKNHNIINQILEKFPNSFLFDMNEVLTVQFASTCKHIIMSHGSYSALIGYLGYYSDIYYPKHIDSKWYGDLFCIDSWKQL